MSDFEKKLRNIAELIQESIHITGWKPRGLNLICAFVYEKDYNKDNIKNFDSLSKQIN